MQQPHPAELEAAWAAQQQQQQHHDHHQGAGGGYGPMLHGPTGPPPAAFVAGAQGQVTSNSVEGTADAAVGDSTGGVFAGGAEGDVREDAEAVAESVDAGVMEPAAGEGEEVSASARSLARQMAGDPDGRFRDSELLRFASRLGTGGLRVSGDKVLALFSPSQPLFARYYCREFTPRLSLHTDTGKACYSCFGPRLEKPDRRIHQSLLGTPRENSGTRSQFEVRDSIERKTSQGKPNVSHTYRCPSFVLLAGQVLPGSGDAAVAQTGFDEAWAGGSAQQEQQAGPEEAEMAARQEVTLRATYVLEGARGCQP